MRFGKNLHKHQVPHWASSYLDYQGLKQRIKLLQGNGLGSQTAPDLQPIVNDLLRGIHDVQEFYNTVFCAVCDQFSTLNITTNLDKYIKWELGDIQELRFHWAAFLQFLAALKRIRWYGTVNSQGFNRLLQKLNYPNARQAYAAELNNVTVKLLHAEFSHQTRVINEMERVETAITTIADLLSHNYCGSGSSLILEEFLQSSRTHGYDTVAIYRAIQNDDVRSFEPPLQHYGENVGLKSSAMARLILILIQLSIIHEAIECLEYLIPWLRTAHDDWSFALHHVPVVITQLIVNIGHQRMLTHSSKPASIYYEQPHSCVQSDSGPQLVRRLLARFNTGGDFMYNHYPIYQVAQYGLSDICQVLLEHMQDADLDNRRRFSESILLKNKAGGSPLELAISCGFGEVAGYLLDFLTRNQYHKGDLWECASGSLLAVAVRTSSGSLEQLLVAGANVNHRNKRGETALHIAVRSGNVKIANKLVTCGASVDTAEEIRGLTPLIIASLEGHIAIVELLLQAGANPATQDHLGWTALDHAAFMGHLSLVQKLKQLVWHTSPDRTTLLPVAQPCHPKGLTKTRSRSVILVNPGSLDSRKKSTFIDLYQATTPASEVGFRVEISLLDELYPMHAVELPILEDMTNNPWQLPTANPSSAKLLFKIQHKAVTADNMRINNHIGSAIALLGYLNQGLGPARESLIRDHTIPIYSTAGCKIIGTVTFSFLVVTPFVHPKLSLPARTTLWNERGRTKVVGHRGLGQNTRNPGRLSIGENTTQSFLKAIDLGADWVELDVQVTKDRVPVVYHDWLVSETGIDTWVHNLTLEQFMHISNSQSRVKRQPVAEHPAPRLRSYSLDSNNNHRPVHLPEQLKNTFEFKQKGFKGNTRGGYIHEPFLTLDDVLSQTPDSVALNMEIKYPMLSEAADDWKSDVLAMEINIFVDTVLSTILSHHSWHSRPIILSSFNPDVCILLSIKQTLFPVLFLNDSGNTPTGDIRASCLQEAIRFATTWGLDGIVMASEPFVFAPRLIQVAQGRGLVTGSYGALNDEPENAKIQAAAGLDIIIVDAVRLISQTLGGMPTGLPD